MHRNLASTMSEDTIRKEEELLIERMCTLLENEDILCKVLRLNPHLKEKLQRTLFSSSESLQEAIEEIPDVQRGLLKRLLLVSETFSHKGNLKKSLEAEQGELQAELEKYFVGRKIKHKVWKRDESGVEGEFIEEIPEIKEVRLRLPHGVGEEVQIALIYEPEKKDKRGALIAYAQLYEKSPKDWLKTIVF